ncbi:MAG: tetratricopeptide repeat protein [Agarilytica sp.]
MCTTALLTAVVSCASNNTQTLGQLKYEEEQEKEIEFEKLTHEQVRNEYKELIDLFEDEKLKERIERRIADVYMMEAVDDQLEDEETSEYVEAIKAYRNILERYPDSPDNAEVFYQLAKAYDLEGEQQEAMRMLTELVRRHPTYKNISEAHFRKADIHFNWQEYDQAKASYSAVTRLSEGRLLLNAHYMLGWVHYKQLAFEAGVNDFAFVLNKILVPGRDIASLNKAEKPLVEDSIHSMSLALDKIGGAETIPEIDSISDRDYTWMLYDHLGEYYLEKELYEQSAKTFRYFVRAHPKSDKAPTLHKKLISAYTKGKFPRQALAEKERYVRSYGITSNYPGNSEGIRAEISSQLIVFLEELARFNYTDAQFFLGEVKKEKDANKDNFDTVKTSKLEKDAIIAFTRSAEFYGEYIQTFPQDQRVDEMRFLKAEAHFQAKQYLLSAEDYELVAYHPVGSSAKENAADSGYAAIISYQNHIESFAGKQKKRVKKFRGIAVDSMLRFSKKFDADERSPTVLTNAAEYLFGLNQYERAISVAQDLVAKENLDETLLKTAYGILAHSFFKLERYAEAETSYVSQRELVAVESEEYVKISERIAATVFKNAEVIELTKGKLAAALELLKLKLLTPDSPIRITAQYDAATLLLGVSEWSKAITELAELARLYPDHELAVEFPRKLALAYQKNVDWGKAAHAYLALYKNDPDPEIKREGLFLAASMYEKAMDYDLAIKYFKRYAYDYEQPFDTRMEARFHLATNYETLGDIGKQLYWLRRIIAGDAKSGEQRTERSRWLAAWSNAKYGDYFASEFRKKKLRQPLQRSLPKKKQFFEDASARYQKSADYGILEFVTMSSYKIGSLYQNFATDLRRAPKPSGLSAGDVHIYNEIIEEQASPFDQLAVEVHQANIDKAWEGHFDSWIAQSFGALSKLYPDRYNKQEVSATYGEEIR